MATQKRYFDYGSPIKSKNSAEPFGLINGIGAILGFDRITNNTGNTGFIIGSNNADSIANKTKMVYLSDENGTVQNYNHAVITPDGIITAISGDLDITKPSSSRKEYMLVATHNYVASSEIESPTILELIPNNTGTSFGDKVNLVDTNISTWYTTIKSWKSGFNQGITVIVAFIDDRGDTPQIYTPFNNSWPIGSSPSTTGSSNIEIQYSLINSGETLDVNIKSLSNIINNYFGEGSRTQPVVIRYTEIPNGSSTYKLINLKLLKLNNGIWNLVGSLKYKLTASNLDMDFNILQIQDSVEGISISGLNSASAGELNTVFTCKNLSLSPVGFTLKNIKAKMGLTPDKNLNLISGKISMRGLNKSNDLASGFYTSMSAITSYKAILDDNLDIEINTHWGSLSSHIISVMGLDNHEVTFDFDLLLDYYD